MASPATRMRKAEIERRNTTILEMVEAGAKYKSIAISLQRAGLGKISTGRISQIVNAELAEVGKHRMEMAERIFDLKLEQLNAIIRTNWGVINAKCAPCKGQGELGEDPDKAPGTPLICEKCHGDGKHHQPRDRAAASKEIRQAIDQQCKMLGLYAPEKFALTDPQGNELEFWQKETATLDEDDLNRELELYLSGVDAGRAELKSKEETGRDIEETAGRENGTVAG